MHKLKITFCLRSLSVLFFFSFFSIAQAISPKDPYKIKALVMDAKTGRVIYEEKGFSPHHPASMAKMMTLYLTFKQLEDGKVKLTDRFYVSQNAQSKKPTKINLIKGEFISVKNAITAAIVKSANDASAVLAEGIAKTEKKFAALMTQEAKKLGMKNTTFQNATGWHDPKQISTPYDMALLARALLRDFPQYYKLFSTMNFNYKGTSYINHNKSCLDKIKGCDGIKTGFFTEPIGANVAASAKRGDKRLIAVVMGGRNGKERFNKLAVVMEKGFKALENPIKKDLYKEKSIKLVQENKKGSSSDFDILLAKLEKEISTNNAIENASKKDT